MRDFRKLDVWIKAHALTLNIYHFTAKFPREELFGLTSQLRRASVSIASNIAEGCGRETKPDFARFLHLAAGSASEVDYQLLLAKDLGYLKEEEYLILADNIAEVKKMLVSYYEKIRATLKKSNI